MHPFLDVNKLTDEEIIERLGRAYTFMNYQISLGHNQMVRSIEEVIETLEGEREKRTAKRTDDEFRRKYPKSELPISLGKIEDNQGKPI